MAERDQCRETFVHEYQEEEASLVHVQKAHSGICHWVVILN